MFSFTIRHFKKMHHKCLDINSLYANHDNSKLTVILRIIVIMDADYFPVNNCVQNSDSGVNIRELSEEILFHCHKKYLYL